MRLAISSSPESVGIGKNRLFAGLLLCWLLLLCSPARAQEPPTAEPPDSRRQDSHQRLNELIHSPAVIASGQEYRIGPDDLLEIAVFEAPELNRTVRVSASGEIALPLLGAVKAQSLTPRELELVLQELLRRTYMKDPHVGVFVREMQSHPVAVFGAVKKPGVYQLRGTKTLLEVLSMAEGLAEDAGDTVIVMRRGNFQYLPPPGVGHRAQETNSEPLPEGQSEIPAVADSAIDSAIGDAIRIDVKDLLQTGDPSFNVPIFPGDIVKVTRAEIVYVVGEVNKPGGFVLQSNENISVLQAIALAEGITRTAATGHARIIRSDPQHGQRTEIPLHLGKIMAGKAPDPLLQPKDIVFIPNSAARSALYRAGEAAISIVSGVIIWRR